MFLELLILYTLEEDYQWGKVRRDRFLECFMKRAQEFSNGLLENKCIEGAEGKEVYDRDFNLVESDAWRSATASSLMIAYLITKKVNE